MATCAATVENLTRLGRAKDKLAKGLLDSKAARICLTERSNQYGHLQIKLVDFSRLASEVTEEEEKAPLSANAFASFVCHHRHLVKWSGKQAAVIDLGKIPALALGKTPALDAASLAEALVSLFQAAILDVTGRAKAAEEADLERQFAAAEHAEQQQLQQRPGPEPIGGCMRMIRTMQTPIVLVGDHAQVICLHTVVRSA